MQLAPEIRGTLYHAARHQKLGWDITWQGKHRIKDRKHAEKAQKLWAKALRMHRATKQEARP